MSPLTYQACPNRPRPAKCNELCSGQDFLTSPMKKVKVSFVRLQLNIWCNCKRYVFQQLWMVYPGFLGQQPRVRFAGRRRCSRLCCSLGGWESQAQQGHGWQQWGRDRDVLARDQWSIRHHMSLQTLKAKDSAKLNALITIWWGFSQDTLFGERAGPSEGDISKICSGQS